MTAGRKGTLGHNNTSTGPQVVNAPSDIMTLLREPR
jgi:hypothetical protein